MEAAEKCDLEALMDSFLTTLFGFPTGILSVGLLLVLGYWILILIGALDLEAPDVDLSIEGPDGAQSAVGSNMLSSLGFSGVPISLALSLTCAFAWLACALSVKIFFDLAPVGLFAGLLILLLSVCLGLFLAGLCARPLLPLYRVNHAIGHAALVGSECVVTTLRVDADFGQATVRDGGADLIIQVRANTDIGLNKGDRALIIEYDEQEGTFTIAAHPNT